MASNSSSISFVHHDVISTHILTKLNGQTLATAACASSSLRTLCTEEKLWTEICDSTWTSINDPRVRLIISTFSAGYRSFFFDSFPLLHHRFHPKSSSTNNRRSPTTELISAVDLKYKNVNVFSKIEITNTGTVTFLCSPFWIQALDSKSQKPTFPARFTDELELELEHQTNLTWIFIDPTRRRSANLSSVRPVLVIRDRSSEEVKLRFATVTAGGWTDEVEWRIEVTVKVGGDAVVVKKVSMEVVDVDGRLLSGEESLVILEEAMEFGERRINGDVKEMYREFMVKRRIEDKRIELDFVDKTWVFVLFVSFFFIYWNFNFS